MARPMRQNLAHLTQAERQAFVDAVRQADLHAYSDGVSYWDKQDQIHQATHNHGGNSFIPWHRELCNRYERLLQQVDPDVALHYWDWTTDPRASPDANGVPVNLCTDALMGTANGVVTGTLAPLHNADQFTGSRGQTLNPADPPQVIRRSCNPGAPGVPSDSSLITGADASPQAQQWTQFRADLELLGHDPSHVFFGLGSNIRNPHTAFEDPFVFLLHSNVDRLFAMWQTQSGQDWRLDQALVFGDQSATADDEGILHNLQPWDGTVQTGSPIAPWTGASSEIEVKTCRHPSVVAPPCYDTLPLTVTQVAPVPGQPIRFLDVWTGTATARALRLRVRGCRRVTCDATLTGDPAFSLSKSQVLSPQPDAFETHDVLIWVILTPGAVGSTPSGTLQVQVAETGDSFSIPIEATVIARPSVKTSLVLDRSGSMNLPSGVASQTRIEVLRSAAPLFVNLMDDDDAVGVVRFDTDAQEAAPVAVAGPQIGGQGRGDALDAISTHATNPLGLTAIGDGVEAGANQLAAAPGTFDHSATVVFTDGHETAPKTIADVASLVTSRVFAIGLGTADQLNPGALTDLANGTGGYLLLTGNPGLDDTTLLQKYFAQVLAGVANNVIVVDPDGFVPSGGEALVPYQLTAADSRSDVIVLSPAADAIQVTLEAPDGTMVDGSSGAQVVTTDDYQTLRVALDPAVVATPAGTWIAHLKLNRRKLGRFMKTLEERNDLNALNAQKAHGLPFVLSVQARSAVRMDVAVSQPSMRPGTVAIVTATLTDSGIPLAHSAKVLAQVTAPDGTQSAQAMDERAEGIFSGDIATAAPGVYRLLVRGEGVTLHGEPFTREELRTLAVWARGDERPTLPPDRPDAAWCDFLRCVLRDKGIARWADEHGLDSKALRRCVEKVCR